MKAESQMSLEGWCVHEIKTKIGGGKDCQAYSIISLHSKRIN